QRQGGEHLGQPLVVAVAHRQDRQPVGGFGVLAAVVGDAGQGFEFFDSGAQGGQVFGAVVGGDFAGDDFEQADADLEDLAHFVQCQVGDYRAAARIDGGQAFAFEDADGVADRAAADVERVRQALFVQGFAGPQLALDDGVAHLRGDLLRHGERGRVLAAFEQAEGYGVFEVGEQLAGSGHGGDAGQVTGGDVRAQLDC